MKMTTIVPFIRETEKAALYRIEGREVWIPKSVISDRVKFPAKDPLLDKETHRITVEDWWWNKEIECDDMDEWDGP